MSLTMVIACSITPTTVLREMGITDWRTLVRKSYGCYSKNLSYKIWFTHTNPVVGRVRHGTTALACTRTIY